MSIKISVIDPANTPRAELLLVIRLLESFAGPTAAATPQPPVTATIPADDTPNVGREIVSPEAAFGDVGNVPPVAGSLATTTPATVFTPPAAPSAPSAAGASAGVDLDSKGMPHDPRIHASTKTKKADGSWTARRQVDPAVVAQVEAELRQLMAIPTPGNVDPAAAFGAAPTTGAAVTPPAPPALIIPPPPPTTAPAAAASIPTAPAGVVAPTPVDFSRLATLVGESIANGKLTQDELVGICAAQGVPQGQFAMLASRQDLVPTVFASISAVLATKG